MVNKFLCRFCQFFIKIGYGFIRVPKQEIIDYTNCLVELPKKIKELGLKKPLIVTDTKLLALGVCNPLIDSCKANGVEYALFSNLIANPTCENAEDGYKCFMTNQCDCIIGFGGGSPIDTAKAIGAIAAKPKKNVRKFMGLLKIRKKIPTLFAIPTTAGTGSEATIASVLVDEKTSHKVAIMDPCLLPSYAILDPMLTVTLPPFMTGTTGMDALCHAIESYTNWKYCRKVEKEAAKKATKLIYDNLLVAYKNGADIEARHNMQLAALYAGKAFTRGSVGYVHAIGHTLSGLYGLPHGQVMAIILPKVLRKYGKSAEKRLAELADVCGINGISNEEKAKNLIIWIENANEIMGIGNSFEQLKKEDFEKIENWAIEEANPLYPCPQVWNKKDVEEILNELLK